MFIGISSITWGLVSSSQSTRWEVVMRQKLLAALTYPRLFVSDSIDLEDCPHDSLFDSSCDRCHNCRLRQECHWLSCLNSFADFANKPTHTVNASLLYSIGLIEKRNKQTLQHSEACTCEPCTWIRDAQQLTFEFQASRRPAYQYRSTH